MWLFIIDCCLYSHRGHSVLSITGWHQSHPKLLVTFPTTAPLGCATLLATSQPEHVQLTTSAVPLALVDPLVSYGIKKAEESYKYSHIKLLSSKPTHSYQPRKQEVNKLRSLFGNLREQHPENVVVSVYLKGQPSCGKNQVAREFGEAYYAEKVGRFSGAVPGKRLVVATLDAKSESRFWQSYYRLALELGCPMEGLASVDRLRDRLTVISHEVQKKLQQYSTWVLIIESMNAESMHS